MPLLVFGLALALVSSGHAVNLSGPKEYVANLTEQLLGEQHRKFGRLYATVAKYAHLGRYRVSDFFASERRLHRRRGHAAGARPG